MAPGSAPALLSLPQRIKVSQGWQGSRGCHSAWIKDDTGRPIGLAVRHPCTGDSAINRVDRLDDEQIIFSDCAYLAQMVRPIIGMPTGSVKEHLVIGKNDDLEHFSNLERTLFHHGLPSCPLFFSRMTGWVTWGRPSPLCAPSP